MKFENVPTWRGYPPAGVYASAGTGGVSQIIRTRWLGKRRYSKVVCIGYAVASGPLRPNEVAPAAMSGGGTIRLFEAAKIPWPGLVRSDVADRLKLKQSVLSGAAPMPPPKPAGLVPAGKK